MNSLELREKRAGLIKEARALWDVASKREGGATAEDQQSFDKFMAESNKVKDEYERMERLETAEHELSRVEERISQPINLGPGMDQPKKFKDARDYLQSAEYRAVFGDFLRNGMSGGSTIATVPMEYRDTILGTDAKGGYLAMPIQLASTIIKIAFDYLFIRQLGTVITMGEAKALGVPQLTTRMADANWTTEVQAVTEDTTMALGRRDLSPNLLSKLSKVSIRMLYGASNVESFLTEELGYKFALTEEKAYLTGSGTGQPLGVFTANALGIPAARDVSAGNTATALGAQNMYEMKYSLKAPYRNDPSCRWLWSRAAINQIMQFKDTQQRYLWEPSLQAGQPDRLLNIFVAESEWVPNTFTTGLYTGALGAFRYYWIAQTDNLTIQRLVELYSGTNEIGFIGRWYLDGSPVLGEAFSRSKLA